MDQFNLYKYKAFVKSVYDGDSITCDLDLGWDVCLKNTKVRLFGIDTPEIRGEEREYGLVSKARVEELILNTEVILESYKDKTGKYGRYLATVWFFQEENGWRNLNELLLAEGLASPYPKY